MTGDQVFQAVLDDLNAIVTMQIQGGRQQAWSFPWSVDSLKLSLGEKFNE